MVKINTLNYGILPIAKSNKYLNNDVILEEIEDNNGDYYSIMQTLNGELVAYLINQ